MGRKLPAELLEARGAFAKNPDRRRVDITATGDLGKAPAHFNEYQAELWEELKTLAPDSKSADRWIAELTVFYMEKFRNGTIKPAEISKFLVCLGKLGLSPADRPKCAMPPTPEKSDEFAEFE